MAYEALLTARLTASPTATDPTLVARVQGGTASLTLDLAALAGAADQLSGAAAQVLEVIFSGSSGGYPFSLSDHGDSNDGIEVDRGLTDKTTWRLSAPASKNRWEPWAVGYEVAFGGAPPPGLARINIAARYGRGAGQFSVPLVTGGLAAASGRSLSQDGHGVTLNGVGPEGRYDRKLVTLQLPPNHGKTHGQIARLAALAAGVPSAAVQIDESIGFPLTRALDMVEEELWGALTDVLLGCGYLPRFDEDGALVALPRAPVAVGIADVRIRAARLLGEEIESVLAEGNADVITCVRVEGTKPVIPENQAEGRTLEVTINASYEAGFEPREAYFDQAYTTSDPDEGVLNALPGADGGFLPSSSFFYDADARTLKSMTVTVKEKQGGCVLAEDVLNFGWKVPEVPRYHYINPADNTGTKIARDNVFIFEPTAVAGDAAPAYLEFRERWSLISRDRKDYVFGGGDDGMELAEVRHRTGAWLNETAHAKVPSAPAPYDWPSEDYIADKYILGGGRVVKNDRESFRGATDNELIHLRPWLEIIGECWNNATGLANPFTDSTTTYAGRGGYLVRTEEVSQGFALLEGTGFWYEGGRVSASEYEEFTDTTTEIVSNNAAPGDSTYTIVTVKGDSVKHSSTSEVQAAEGYLPAIPRCDPEDAARKDGEPFKAELCRGLAYRIESWQIIRSDFVEDALRAGALADILLREAQGIPVTVSIPFDATIRPGMTVSLVIPDLRIAHLGWVDRHKLVINGRFRYSELVLKLHP